MIIRPARVDDAEALTVILNDVIENTAITFTSELIPKGLASDSLGISEVPSSPAL